MNVIFDFGGVVFRWRPAVLLAQCLPAHTATPEALARLVDGFFQNYGGDWGEFDRGTIEAPALAQRIAHRLKLQVHEVAAVIDAIPAELQAIETSVELMRRVKAAGHRLFYLSNMPVPYAAHLETHHAFFEWFDGGVFSSRVQLIKPDPAIFHHALRVFGSTPDEAVFLDDHRVNVETARGLGIRTVHFADAAQAQGELEALGVL
ncbi:HAD family phosphatase [Schlegelella sp. S2-27]|uniref:HAD family phosphatase n=1 Tax=Caldimonas mangrovi TaxID=2944811 RepID=A0ABT0YIN5_9BURK|nr:HAD family phosphatase [Caldimonas mangrovi]MCM5678596.1 HAD family phosphatase [Caldimonas mangrovi]